jgi:hypothetical protein
LWWLLESHAATLDGYRQVAVIKGLTHKLTIYNSLDYQGNDQCRPSFGYQACPSFDKSEWVWAIAIYTLAGGAFGDIAASAFHVGERSTTSILLKPVWKLFIHFTLNYSNKQVVFLYSNYCQLNLVLSLFPINEYSDVQHMVISLNERCF